MEINRIESGIMAAMEQGLISDAALGLVAFAASNQIRSVVREGDTISIHFKSELIEVSDPVPSAAVVYERCLRTVIEEMDAAYKHRRDTLAARASTLEIPVVHVAISGLKDAVAVVAQIQRELSEFNRLQKDASGD